jgi:molybdopterin-guanine dinucleotide biosynthesis protein A
MKLDATVIILAGGRSQRMGQAKAALPFGPTTILAQLTAELIENFSRMVIVATRPVDQQFSLETVLSEWIHRIEIIRDETSFAGPIPALIQGLRAAAHQTVFVCSCDLPLLRSSTANEIITRLENHDAAVPVIGGKSQPLCAAYRRAATAKIESAAQVETRLTAVIEALDLQLIAESELRSIEPDLRSFVNVNTPEDYRRALRLAGV